LVVDVRLEDINGTEIFAIGPAGALGRGEKVGVEGDMDDFMVEDPSEKS